MLDDPVDDLLDDILDDFTDEIKSTNKSFPLSKTSLKSSPINTNNENDEFLRSSVQLESDMVTLMKESLSVAAEVSDLPINNNNNDISNLDNTNLVDQNTLSQFANLLTNANNTNADNTTVTNEDEMASEFERLILQALTGAEGSGNGSNSSLNIESQVNNTPKKVSSAKDHVAQTMSRMKDSSKKVSKAEKNDAQAAAAASAAAGLNPLSLLTGNVDGLSDEALEALISQMAGMDPNLGAGGPGMGEGGFENVLNTLMSQLVSKDILLEPMIQLDEKYPKWLAVNKEKITNDEYIRYVAQHNVVKQIIATFKEEENTKNQKSLSVIPKDNKPIIEDVEDNKKESSATTSLSTQIMELMQKMQEYGNPPEEIMKELAESSGADANLLFGNNNIPSSNNKSTSNNEDPMAGIDSMLNEMLNGKNGIGANDEAMAKQFAEMLANNPGGAGGTPNPNDCTIM